MFKQFWKRISGEANQRKLTLQIWSAAKIAICFLIPKLIAKLSDVVCRKMFPSQFISNASVVEASEDSNSPLLTFTMSMVEGLYTFILNITEIHV